MSKLTDSLHKLSRLQTFLFVPADRPERYIRALESGVGAVIIDLEDAVAPDKKDQARLTLAEKFETLPIEDKGRILIRINSSSTQWHAADCILIEQLSKQGLGGVMFPKAENVEDLNLLTNKLEEPTVLIPLIESVKGLDSINEIAIAPKVLRLAFGHLDFQVDTGLACDVEEIELTSVRLEFVLASKRAGLASPIDGVTTDWKDTARLEKDAQRSKRGGFGAKLCIHPIQVSTVQNVFNPTDLEILWAKRVIEAANLANGGVVSLDGRMVDMPVVLQAQRILTINNELDVS